MTEAVLILAALPTGVFIGAAVESARRARAARARYSARMRRVHRCQS